ncbi:MAG: response regulator transcription factor [Pseudobutyrivibrio sp.]|nr:response regulator transcription factor [Pseudobutyrivibrio sp.]
MINLCIVEDETDQADILQGLISDYEKSHNCQLSVTHLSDGIDLVDGYCGQYDIILLDIQMKHMNGMDAAEKIRALDNNVVIIFITSTVQYAVQGYAVDALGYVLKPVSAAAFEKLLDKSIDKVNSSREKVYIKISVEDKQLKLDCQSIYYIESSRNNVVIHCKNDSFVTSGPLKKFEELLWDKGFFKCHNAYLVNLSMVDAIQKEDVILLDNTTLPISRNKKKEFMSELTKDIL